MEREERLKERVKKECEESSQRNEEVNKLLKYYKDLKKKGMTEPTLEQIESNIENQESLKAEVMDSNGSIYNSNFHSNQS